MPKEILRREVQRLIDDGAQVLDVLEAAEYRQSHLPGAVHTHLRRLPLEARAKLAPEQPVIAYCYDSG